MNATLLSTGRLARAELRKLFTTKAVPVSLAIATVLAVGSVLIDAMVAGQHGAPRLGTDASVYQMLKFGAVTCVVMLILGPARPTGAVCRSDPWCVRSRTARTGFRVGDAPYLL